MPDTYLALVGLSFYGQRVEAGELTGELPADSVGWLLEQGCIEPADEPEPSDEAEADDDSEGGDA